MNPLKLTPVGCEEALRTLKPDRLWWLVNNGINALSDSLENMGHENAELTEIENLHMDLLAVAELVRVIWMLRDPRQATRSGRNWD
ncbi:hypothetical protein J8F10_06580 [Gemmata sp. G18]|uniref:Uncharacterized protein n=1 Tax=Gemmata palustris TaxID=2822762 RepID=A0ABS5BML1_9BACT|nr:hypothetical protein [Gemmata palustris]MBP3954946.1 hypothetical protein [Gemmata palustris]